MDLDSLPGGFVVQEDTDNGASQKAEALKQIDWLRSAVESGEVTGFLACGLQSDGDAFGLGVIADGVSLPAMHASLVKLHDVFHSGADEVVARLAEGDDFEARDAGPTASH